MLIQYTQTASIVIWYYQSEWDTMGNGMRSYIIYFYMYFKNTYFKEPTTYDESVKT